MKFSIIIPTHDRPGDLAACLRSIREQNTSHEVETIVIDDAGSTDLSSLMPQMSAGR